MADVVKFGADSTEYFAVINQMQAKLDELSAKTQRTGRSGEQAFGFARDEKIGRNLREIATSFASGASAADLLAEAMQRVADSVKGGLVLAAGAGIAFGIYEAFRKAKEEAYALNEEIRKVLASASGPASYSSIDQLTAKLQKIDEELNKIHGQSPLGGLFSALANPDISQRHGAGQARQIGYNAAVAQSEQRAGRDAELLKQREETLAKITQKLREQADIEDTRQHVSQETAALDKLDLEYAEKRAQLVREGPNQNPAAVSQLDRQHALEREALQHETSLRQASTIEQIKQARIGSDRLQSLREEVEFTKELYNSTAGRSIEETLAAQPDYEKAVAALKQEVFQRELNLRTAQAMNEATQLDLDGHHELADLMKTIASTEEKYLNLVNGGNTALANAVLLQGQLNAKKQAQNAAQSLVEQQARENLKSPQQKFEDLKQNQDLYAAMKSVAYREGLPGPNAPPRFGEAYDPFGPSSSQRAAELREAMRKEQELNSINNFMNDETTQLMMAARNFPKSKPDIAAQGGGDLGGIKVLDGADFSGLAQLSGMSFENLQPLQNISIQ